MLHITQTQSDWYSRIALFIIFFWFGFLKVLFLSPADAIVADLLEKTLPFIAFEPFFIFLGCIEMLIGVLFLIPSWTRYALPILLIHMLTTFGPLLLLAHATWQTPFALTIEGQYIVKNLAIVALAIGIYVDTVHVDKEKSPA